MITVTILIPLADNEATTFAPSHHTAFEIQLAAIFGGITRLPGEFVGAWFGGETLYADTNRAYQVAVPGLPPGGDLRLLPRPGRDHRTPQGLTPPPAPPGAGGPRSTHVTKETGGAHAHHDPARLDHRPRGR